MFTSRTNRLEHKLGTRFLHLPSPQSYANSRMEHVSQSGHRGNMDSTDRRMVSTALLVLCMISFSACPCPRHSDSTLSVSSCALIVTQLLPSRGSGSKYAK
ncbi:hypothetical protein OBBRIDRAFT_350581 [Obba rivulosa]|uniref:Uncharacterized protein n=1 Tax=Obba rivulosa TaxID=1052685 RepID=A0A8E2B5N0_9APHY|nr:hypothetical protein OBBRIDRAFT_350581 [Obba rivulosa]